MSRFGAASQPAAQRASPCSKGGFSKRFSPLSHRATASWCIDPAVSKLKAGNSSIACTSLRRLVGTNIGGVWPLDDPCKSSFSIARVKRIFSSPSRLPALLANKLYRGGETSMGGTSFALILRDGRRIPVLTGNAVDFPEYPPEVKPSDIVDVIHGYNEISASRIGTADYCWCLYTTRS